jgi:hypothetical protein
MNSSIIVENICHMIPTGLKEIYERNQLKKGNVRKLKKNESLRAYVLEKLEDDYSPSRSPEGSGIFPKK